MQRKSTYEVGGYVMGTLEGKTKGDNSLN